jgi:alcohol dehydrogenase (nicotinoprotein)
MKTRAAVLRKGGTPWEITELDLDEPKAGEVLVRMEAAGLCHSDEHIRAKGMARLPTVGGHEGSGTTGKQNLCDAGRHGTHHEKLHPGRN